MRVYYIIDNYANRYSENGQVMEFTNPYELYLFSKKYGLEEKGFTTVVFTDK